MSENVRREPELWVCVYRRLKTDWRSWTEGRKRERVKEREVTWLPMMPNLYLKLHQQLRPQTLTHLPLSLISCQQPKNAENKFVVFFKGTNIRLTDVWGSSADWRREREREKFVWLRVVFRSFLDSVLLLMCVYCCHGEQQVMTALPAALKQQHSHHHSEGNCRLSATSLESHW